MKTLVVQSFRRQDVPPWIARCLGTVKAWAGLKGYDYLLTGDEAFDLCGAEFLAQVAKADIRAVTNLCRLELLRRAFADGYERAVWLDADMFVFDPAAFGIDQVKRYAFAHETWVSIRLERLAAVGSVNNSAIVCVGPQPDLDFLIETIRYIARSRTIISNYQVGGDLIKGLCKSLRFEILHNVGMFSPLMVLATALDRKPLLRIQALMHGAPVHAANLCASPAYPQAPSLEQTLSAMDRLEQSRGEVLNGWLEREAPTPVRFGDVRYLDGPAEPVRGP